MSMMSRSHLGRTGSGAKWRRAASTPCIRARHAKQRQGRGRGLPNKWPGMQTSSMRQELANSTGRPKPTCPRQRASAARPCRARRSGRTARPRGRQCSRARRAAARPRRRLIRLLPRAATRAPRSSAAPSAPSCPPCRSVPHPCFISIILCMHACPLLPRVGAMQRAMASSAWQSHMHCPNSC
jgi:hypothetical protein